MEVFDFFFPFNQVDWDWGFISNRLMFLVGFFSMVYGWRLAWWKENSMVRVFAFKKNRENGWIFRRRRRIGKEETVCLQFWWSEFGEGTDGGRNSVAYDYKLCSLFLRYSNPFFSLYFGRLDSLLYWVLWNSVLVQPKQYNLSLFVAEF